MAIMYPKNINLYKHTASEKRVFKELEKQLPDTYSVYFSVQWVYSANGHKEESECDFLIYSEREGFLTCEVKGGIGLMKDGNRFYLIEKDGNRMLNRSPMEQSEESSRYFEKLYVEEYNDNFKGVYGSISLFPFYKVNDPVLLDHRDKTVVLDADNLDKLAESIRRAFLFYKSKSRNYGFMTETQNRNFKNMINKKIASQAIAGSIIDAKEDEINNVNRIQNNLIYFLNNYPRTFISGGAGTGKTWIGMKFAKQALLSGKNTLFCASNKKLIEAIRKAMDSYQNFDALTFNDLVKKDGVNNCDASEQMLDKYNSLSYKKYDCIVVDEAQDFDEYQALILSSHLNNEYSEFRVFYDETQNIYNKNFKDGFDIKTKPFILRENLRNTESIYDWSKEKTELGIDVITNKIIGPLPETYKFRKKYELLKYLESKIVSFIDNENVDISLIVILLDHDCFDMVNGSSLGRWNCVEASIAAKDDIKISLVDDYKGLESDIVFYVHTPATPKNYNYVAYTRAVFYLFELILDE